MLWQAQLPSSLTLTRTLPNMRNFQREKRESEIMPESKCSDASRGRAVSWETGLSLWRAEHGSFSMNCMHASCGAVPHVHVLVVGVLRSSAEVHCACLLHALLTPAAGVTSLSRCLIPCWFFCAPGGLPDADSLALEGCMLATCFLVSMLTLLA